MLPRYTVQQQEKIQRSMSVEQVESIMGGAPTNIEPTKYGDHPAEQYIWRNPDSTWVSVTFVDGKSGCVLADWDPS